MEGVVDPVNSYRPPLWAQGRPYVRSPRAEVMTVSWFYEQQGGGTPAPSRMPRPYSFSISTGHLADVLYFCGSDDQAVLREDCSASRIGARLMPRRSERTVTCSPGAKFAISMQRLMNSTTWPLYVWRLNVCMTSPSKAHDEKVRKAFRSRSESVYRRQGG